MYICEKNKIMLKLDVFAASIGNLTDARYFAAREAKWLGFCLDQMNPQSVTAMEVNAIKEWLDGVEIVGEFGDVDKAYIEEQISNIDLKAILAGPFTSAEAIKGLNVPVFKEIVLEKNTTDEALEEMLESYEGMVAHFILDFDKNKVVPEVSALSFDKLSDLCSRYSIMVSMPWELLPLESVMEKLDLSGIMMRGGEEEKVGFKSFDDLDELLDILEIEEEY